MSYWMRYTPSSNALDAIDAMIMILFHVSIVDMLRHRQFSDTHFRVRVRMDMESVQEICSMISSKWTSCNFCGAEAVV